MTTTNLTRKDYADRKGARRALAKIGEHALAAAKELIREDQDGRFYFFLEDAERVEDDFALPDETITEEDEQEVAAKMDAEEKNETASKKAREEMKKSLKLDRTIVCLENAEVYANAFQMWKANPSWMSSAQVDRLTGTLYRAAKNGDKVVVEVNGRHFELVNVEGK